MQFKKNGDFDRKDQAPLVEPLSEREIEILELIADNLSKREIAERLTLAYSTVKWYTQQTYRKLAVNSRRQAVLQARELGLLSQPLLAEPPSPSGSAAGIANPYKGLMAFQESDAANFFGREALTERLVARLGEEGLAGRFLAVVGPSGSGKSSLVKAGLIPALRQGVLVDSKDWLIVEMTPGDHPLMALGASLLRIAGNPSLSLKNQVQLDERGILEAAQLLLPADGSELLLVIDQFEEIFTLVDDQTEASVFLERLHKTVTDPFSQVRVVITLRADFFDRTLQNPALSRLVLDRMEVVIPLALDEMEQAIQAPAKRVGVSMDSELVAAIVADMVDQPGALPLLQYALTEIFELREDRQLSLGAYRATGGVQGVLERRAEEAFCGLSREGKIAARQAFLRLVTLGEGMDTEGFLIPDTRRRVLRSELEAVMLTSQPPSLDSGSQESDSAEAISEALEAFGKARLLFFDRDAAAHSPTVEIAHEALLSEWQRLRHWLEEEREDIRMQRALGRSATEWILADRDPSFLLRGTRMNLFENWVEEANVALTGDEHAFLHTSLAERQAQQAAETARLKRESELAEQARQQAHLATARELAAQAGNNLQVDPERSILLSLQSLRVANTKEGINALHRAIQSSRVRATLTVSTEKAWSIDFSPDGETLAAANFTGEVTVWGASNWRKLFSLPGEVARYSPDGIYLASGSQDGTVSIWDLATRQSLWTMKGHHQFIDCLRFSPDGRLLVSTSDDLTFIVWDVNTGQDLFSSSAAYYASFSPDGSLLITSDDTESGSVINLWGVDHNWALLNQLLGYSKPAFSPDGRWLVAAGGRIYPIGIFLWDLSNVDLESMKLSTLKPKAIPAAHDNAILNFAFSSDSSWLASVSQDGTAKVWHLSDKEIKPLMTLSGHTGGIYNVAFSPDNTRLATAGQDGTVRIWDITPAGASEWFAFAGHSDSRYRMSLTQGGRYLVVASDDGAANVWDLEAGKQLFSMTSHGGPLFSASISPDGSLLATAGYDNAAKIWKLNLAAGMVSSEPLLTLDRHATGSKVGQLFPGLTSAVFSPDGTRVATGGVDGMARIWNAKTGQQLLSVQVHPDHRGVTSLAFSPDRRLLATASDGPKPLAKIWDIAFGAEIATFSGHRQAERIWGLAFSPDGERVATGAQGSGLKIWGVKTGQELQSFVGHTSTVVGVAFSPDGKYLASASGDHTARVWDAFTGEELQRYTSSTGALLNIAFTPDGKRLIASGAGYLYGYIFDQDELVHLAESRLTRGFTPAECRQFLHMEECPPQKFQSEEGLFTMLQSRAL